MILKKQLEENISRVTISAVKWAMADEERSMSTLLSLAPIIEQIHKFMEEFPEAIESVSITGDCLFVYSNKLDDIRKLRALLNLGNWEREVTPGSTEYSKTVQETHRIQLTAWELGATCRVEYKEYTATRPVVHCDGPEESEVSESESEV